MARRKERMALPETQQIYRQRSEVAETPHLWRKAKFGLRQFHVRGLWEWKRCGRR
jgi:hypothetical protein